MRKFHPANFGYESKGKMGLLAEAKGQTLVHSCSGCGKHHPHSGEMVVRQWCNECSAISIYKAVSKVMLPANTNRLMTTVVV